MLHGPGKIEFKASMKDLDGPQADSPSLPALAHPQNIGNVIELLFHYDDLEAIAGAPYTVTFSDGTVRQGFVDSRGSALLDTVPPGPYTVELGEDPRDWIPEGEIEPEYKRADVLEKARAEIEAERLAIIGRTGGRE